MNYLLQLLMAYLGSLGFGILYNLHGKKLLFASLGGLLAWAVYLLVNQFTPSPYPCAFLASVALTPYSELMARWRKTPATVFLVTSAIPLIPGGNLYETMRCVVQGDWSAAVDNGLVTAQFALAIAVGMSLIWTLSTMLSGFRKYVKHRKNNGHE